MQGVDEDAPAVDLRKRKADGEAEVSGNVLQYVEPSDSIQGKAKKQKADESRGERKNTAIYVTSLPLDATEDEIYDTFSKYGVIAESAENDQPRIKLYADDKGKFKGDALIGEILVHNQLWLMLIKSQCTSATSLCRLQFRCWTTPISASERKDRWAQCVSQKLMPATRLKKISHWQASRRKRKVLERTGTAIKSSKRIRR